VLLEGQETTFAGAAVFLASFGYLDSSVAPIPFIVTALSRISMAFNV
jgi:hypothetical protein